MVGKSGTMRGSRVLIVDDSAQMTSLLSEVFVDCGALVSTSNTGDDGLQRLQLVDYDLVVLDLLMPRPDGRDIIGFMQQAMPWFLHRTILLTAERYKGSEMVAFSGMGVHVMYKPFELDELRSVARDIVERVQSANISN